MYGQSVRTPCGLLAIRTLCRLAADVGTVPRLNNPHGIIFLQKLLRRLVGPAVLLFGVSGIQFARYSFLFDYTDLVSRRAAYHREKLISCGR
jgi:hypothetical protein